MVYRCSSNLKDLLIKDKLMPQTRVIGTKCKPYNRPCVTCPRIRHTDVVMSETNIRYRICRKYNCQSRSCFYCPTCKHCYWKYVRERSQTINEWYRQHETHIKSIFKTLYPSISMKRIMKQQTKISTFWTESDKNKRLCLEEAWIHLLNTIWPNGLNAMF